MRYVAFLHTDGEGWGISFPDFPGCVSDGATEDEALARGEEALGFHVEGMMEDDEAPPEPRSVAAVMADPSLAEWREGALIAYVPLLLDRGSPRRVNVSLDAGLPRRHRPRGPPSPHDALGLSVLGCSRRVARGARGVTGTQSG